MELKDQVAIVTGSGKGLGAATALELARRGAHVVVNDLLEDQAKAVAKEIEGAGVKSLATTQDVSKHDEAAELVARTKEKFGRVDILVNNAGILRDSMLMKLKEKDWDDVIRVNLKGPFNMAQACAAHMKEQKSGRIVNLASVAWLGNVGQTNYSASKAGVVGLTRTWALELARYGVSVNAIAPGLIESDMTAQIPPDIKERLVKGIPLQRMGSPTDIAQLVAFLSGPQSAYITGQVIQIDGGLAVGLKLS